MGKGDPDIAVLERFFGAVYRRDRDAAAEVLDEDVEWHTTRELPGGGVFRGREEVERVLRDQEAMFDELQAIPQRFVRYGDRIVAEVRLTGRHRDSDAVIDMHVGQVWEVGGGRATRFRAFLDPAEAHAVAERESAR